MPKSKLAKQTIVLDQDEIANIVCTYLFQDGQLPAPGASTFRVELFEVTRGGEKFIEMHVDPEPVPPKPPNKAAACNCEYCKAGLGKAMCEFTNRRDR